MRTHETEVWTQVVPHRSKDPKGGADAGALAAGIEQTGDMTALGAMTDLSSKELRLADERRQVSALGCPVVQLARLL